MPQCDLRWQMSAQAGLRRLVATAFPPRQIQRVRHREQEITLPHTFTIQHRLDKGGLVVAGLLNRLSHRRIIGAASFGEQVLDQGHHGEV
jgi:hypothetical protein